MAASRIIAPGTEAGTEVNECPLRGGAERSAAGSAISDDDEIKIGGVGVESPRHRLEEKGCTRADLVESSRSGGDPEHQI